MRTVSRALAIAAATGLLVGGAVAPSARAQTAPELKTEEQKTLYAIGLAVAGSLSSFALSPAELELVKSGLTDGVQVDCTVALLDDMRPQHMGDALRHAALSLLQTDF